MTGVAVKKISYGGWNNCVAITNHIVDLVVTVDVGPRIIRYGFREKENELCEVRATMGLSGGDKWRIYGGHRLWHSPESESRTYEPDNAPVEWNEITNGIKTVQKTEQVTGIRKEMEIRLSPDGTSVDILHRLINSGSSPVELSVWSITAMATGGIEAIPIKGKDTGLLPNRVMALWPYTRLDDPRVHFGDRYIILRQDPLIKQPFKIGTSNENGWAAYFNHDNLFIKQYEHQKDARYPDFGASYETYTNYYMLELETLSPLQVIEPSAYAEHMEKWHLYENVVPGSCSEDEIHNALKENIPASLYLQF